MMMNMSEIGSTTMENTNGGTDHASAICLLVGGGNVNGGVYNCGAETHAKKSELLRYNVAGGFSPAIEQAFLKDHSLIRDVAQDTLDSHFPESLHEDIDPRSPASEPPVF